MTDDQLKDALVANNIDFLSLNKDEYDINHRFSDENNDTLLLYALSDSESEVYSYLLKNAPDIYAENGEGENILHSIVFSGDVRRLYRFEELFSDIIPTLINRKAKDGTTPLLLSVLLEKKEIFDYLLMRGADVNLADHEDNAPIHVACYSGQTDMVIRLAEHHAILNRRTKKGNYPLALAINEDHLDIIRYLIPLIYHF